MADFPTSVYAPRTKENRSGVVYDPTKTKQNFAEDVTKLDDEVVALENYLIGRNKIDFNFSSLDAFMKSAGVTIEGLNCVKLLTTNTLNNYQYLQGYVGDDNQFVAETIKNPIFETEFALSNVSNIEAYVGSIFYDSAVGFGFKISNNTLYAMYFDSDGVEHTHAIATLSTFHFYKVRCEVVSGVSLKFYVDNELLYDYGNVSLSDSFVYIAYRIKTLTTSARSLIVRLFHWEADF